MKIIATVILFGFLSFASNAQTKSQSDKQMDSAKYTVAILSSFPGSLFYVRIIDGISVDPYFQLPTFLKVIKDVKLDFDSTVKSIGMGSLTEESDRPKLFRIINTESTKQHKSIYKKTRLLPPCSKLINLPVIVDNRLYLPADYPALEKINIADFKHFEYIEGTLATSLYGERMLFGAIRVRR